MPDQRRFDSLEQTVASLSRELDDLRSTTLARLATHTHSSGGALVTTPFGAIIGTSQTTTSTSYVDLASVGPAVTVNLPVAARCLVLLGAALGNVSAAAQVLMSYTITGDVSVAATDQNSLMNSGSGNFERYSTLHYLDLSAGTYTFTAKYRVAGGTGGFADRRLSVIPFPMP